MRRRLLDPGLPRRLSQKATELGALLLAALAVTGLFGADELTAWIVL